MANWSVLKAAIAAVIKTNGNNEITGQILQDAIKSVISNLGENATFKGVATPTTAPGTPDGILFYLASKYGTYSNFAGIKIYNDEIAILSNATGSWVKTQVYKSVAYRKARINDFINRQDIYNLVRAIAYDTFAGYLNGSGIETAYAGYTVEYHQVEPGDVIKITGGAYPTSSQAYVFWDNDTNKNIIELGGVYSTLSGDIYAVCPDNATVLAITHGMDGYKLETTTKITQDSIQSIFEKNHILTENIFNVITGTSFDSFEGYLNSSGIETASTSKSTKYYNVDEWVLYKLTGYTQTTGKIWVLWDNETDKNIIDSSASYSTGQSILDYILVPKGAGVLAVTHNMTMRTFDSKTNLTQQNILAIFDLIYENQSELFKIVSMVNFDSYNGYLNSSGIETAYAGRTVKYYNVDEFSLIRVSGYSHQSGVIWVAWDNETDKNILASSKNYAAGSGITDTVFIPEGATVIATTNGYSASEFAKESTLRIHEKIGNNAIEIFKANEQIYGISAKAVATTYANSFLNTSGKGFNTNAGWSCKEYDVVGGEVYKITGTKAPVSTHYTYVFWDNNIDRNVLGGVKTYDGYAYVIVPYGATKLVTTHALSANELKSISKIPSIEAALGGNAIEIFKANEQIYGISAKAVATTYANSFLNTSGKGFNTNAGWSCKEYDVVGGEVYKITGTKAPVSTHYTYVFWDNNIDRNVLGGVKTYDGYAYVIVPYGATKLVTTHALSANELESISKIPSIEAALGGITDVFGFGDSLMAAAGGGGTSIITVLQEHLDLLPIQYNCYNRGVGGEDTTEIAGRQGGIPIYLHDEITLLATGAAVTIPIWNDGSDHTGLQSLHNDADVNLLIGGSAGVNPVYVQDVECTLSWDGTNYKLTPTTAPARDRIIPAGSFITCAAAKSSKTGVVISFIGQNGGYSSGDDLVSQHLKMRAFKGDNRYIIITSHGNGYPTVTTPIKNEFGLNVIDGKQYFSTYAIYDAIDKGYLPDDGTYPTAQDLSDMAAGNAPESLRADSIHLNAIGYRLYGDLVYTRGQQLGFWQ